MITVRTVITIILNPLFQIPTATIDRDRNYLWLLASGFAFAAAVCSFRLWHISAFVFRGVNEDGHGFVAQG